LARCITSGLTPAELALSIASSSCDMSLPFIASSRAASARPASSASSRRWHSSSLSRPCCTKSGETSQVSARRRARPKSSIADPSPSSGVVLCSAASAAAIAAWRCSIAAERASASCSSRKRSLAFSSSSIPTPAASASFSAFSRTSTSRPAMALDKAFMLSP